MLDTIFATKNKMTQVWDQTGKRLPVTRMKVSDNIVVGVKEVDCINNLENSKQPQPCLIFEIGYGKKKLKRMTKPLREQIKKSGFSFGVKQIKGVKIFAETEELETLKDSYQAGSTLKMDEILEVGDVIQVTGISKGKGFAGGMKRHNFHGGPRTHGQSDRERAIGSIGAMTDPGRVVKGKKMPGHMGVEQTTVKNLLVVHIDPEAQEVWVSGPVPGHFGSTLRIKKTGLKKDIELNKQASGIKETKPAEIEQEPANEKEEA